MRITLHKSAFDSRKTLLIFLIICITTSDAAKKKGKGKTTCRTVQFDRSTMNFKAWFEQHTICKLLTGIENKYDAKVRPSGGKTLGSPEEPVVVSTSLIINSVSAVSEKNMEYMAQFQFQQEWFDNRLNFEHLGDFRAINYINVARDQKLWIPDTFFQNERNGWYHVLDQENKFLKVRSDGKVFYNRRLTLILSCNMNLLRYPMDVQRCVIDFASYAYTTEDIIYKWDAAGVDLDSNANGDLPNFEITSYNMSKCDSITNTGWFQSEVIRTVNKNLPPVSYTKAIDVWIGACVVFIFASLIEYAVVNYMGILDEHRQMRKIAANRRRLSTMINADSIYETSERSIASNKNSWSMDKKRVSRRKWKNEVPKDVGEEQHELVKLSLGTINTSSRSLVDWDPEGSTVDLKHRKKFELVRWCNFLSTRGKAERIDIIARVAIPVAFLFFNVAYWFTYMYYLVRKKK